MRTARLGTAWALAHQAAQPRTEPRAQRASAPPPVVPFSPRDWPPLWGRDPLPRLPSAISQSHRPTSSGVPRSPRLQGAEPQGAPPLGPSPSAAGPFRVGGRGHETRSDWPTLAARCVRIGLAQLAGAWLRRLAGVLLKAPRRGRALSPCAMAYQGLAQEYLGMPAVTRAYTTACVLTTAAVVRAGGAGTGVLCWGGCGAAGAACLASGSGGSCPACVSQQLEFITPFQLYFNPDLIFRKLQVRPCPGARGPDCVRRGCSDTAGAAC